MLNSVAIGGACGTRFRAAGVTRETDQQISQNLHPEMLLRTRRCQNALWARRTS